MSTDQARAEGLCLRYPENLGLHQVVTYEMAVSMLLKATTLSQQVPFAWGWIDKPVEGQMFLIFMPPQTSFPVDGIRYQEGENQYNIPAGANRELEITESKYGFIPSSSDTSAWRVRRRYRLSKGGHPQLVLVHYGKGAGAPIIPTLAVQPVRSYPLRQFSEPSVYVMGDKLGQKVYPPGHPLQGQPYHPPAPTGMGGGMGGGGGGIGMRDVLTQQNRDMDALERRNRERARVMPPAAAQQVAGGGMGVPGGPGMQQRQAGPRIEDDDSADEIDQISTRSLALTRYKRNHELMNEVFQYAAFGDPTRTDTVSAKNAPAPYSIFNENEMKEKMVNLEAEIEQLRVRAAERKVVSRCTPLPEMMSESAGLQVADVSIDGMIVV